MSLIQRGAVRKGLGQDFGTRVGIVIRVAKAAFFEVKLFQKLTINRILGGQPKSLKCRNNHD